MSHDYTEHKNKLEALKAEYEQRIEKIEDHLHHPQDDLDEHWDDQAISMRQDDMRKNLLMEAKRNLQYVENALSRIENGTYGECVECGEEIDDKRLDAVPYATLCMEHAE